MKIVMVGFGAVAQSLLPMLCRNYGIDVSSIKIIDPVNVSKCIGCSSVPLELINKEVTQDNFSELLKDLDRSTILINLSVNVSSVALVAHCHSKGALYIDTCIEPWAGYYFDPIKSPGERTNYVLRGEMLSLRKFLSKGPTAVIAHGANPGLVSHFVKKALLDLRSSLMEQEADNPFGREEWASLAASLKIKTIHIAEHDTQYPFIRKSPGEFVNTWSVDGFISEGCQPTEMGWGTHEVDIPEGLVKQNSGYAAYINRPGMSVRVRTWTPASGPCLGYLVTHNESISIADFLTYERSNGLRYCPTVHYAYRPCDEAILSLNELSANYWQQPICKKVLKGAEIAGGGDYLGVLLMGHEKNAYWYGSVLYNDEAVKINPESSATLLQVAAGVFSGIKWALAHPEEGIVEAEDMDHVEILKYAEPYLGNMMGVYTDWSPLDSSNNFYPLRSSADWQFVNFLE